MRVLNKGDTTDGIERREKALHPAGFEPMTTHSLMRRGVYCCATTAGQNIELANEIYKPIASGLYFQVIT